MLRNTWHFISGYIAQCLVLYKTAVASAQVCLIGTDVLANLDIGVSIACVNAEPFGYQQPKIRFEAVDGSPSDILYD